MNLHSIVRGNITAINPDVVVTVRLSQGFTVDDNFRQVPTYRTFTGIRGQVQPLSTDELRQIDALNIQGTHRGVYLNGAIAGLVRVTGQGGDLVVTPDNRSWLVTRVFEQWPDWCHAAMTLQGLDYTYEDEVTVAAGIPSNGYVAEDGVTYYVAEDGVTYYVQES